MDKVALEILEKVDGFYSSAFSQLITVTLGLVAFVGVFIPLLASYYQSRTIRLERESLEKDFEEKASQIREELKAELVEDLASKLEEFETTQEKRVTEVLAGVFHIQANNQISQGRYRNATNSIIGAIRNNLASDDEHNLQGALEILTERCLPKITAEEEPNLEGLNAAVTGIIESLEELNGSGRYTRAILELRTACDKAIKRLNQDSGNNA